MVVCRHGCSRPTIDRWPAILRQSRFVPTPPAFYALVKGGSPRRNIVMTFCTEKNWNGLATRW